ncbi:hypothetical protein L208DRAFT_153003 [Tricholoma matsutake]|nr:hypothetical protein L208DRAFT_153003 [Tricholoma matsutake 945]
MVVMDIPSSCLPPNVLAVRSVVPTGTCRRSQRSSCVSSTFPRLFLESAVGVVSCLVRLSLPTLRSSFLLLPSLRFFSFFFPSHPLSTIAGVTTPYSPPRAGCHTLKYLPIRLFPPLFLVLTCGSNPL